jgi:hypothetical protein
MPTITRAGGRLVVTLPETLRVGEDSAPIERPSPADVRRRRAGGPIARGAGDRGPATTDSALLSALQMQDMELVDAVPLEPAAEARPRTRRGRAAAPAATFQIEVAPQEDAVLLEEQGGMYSWVFPSKVAPAGGQARRGTRAAPAARRVTFRVELGVAASPASGAVRRGLISDFAFGKVKAFVLKFAARVAVGGAMAFLERNVRRGLVRLASADVAGWQLVNSPTDLVLPADRPPRILLFVHGTFSSTVGGYFGLTLTPWGRAFLDAARAAYDAVIGFDHATLSVDPLANAAELLHLLEGMDWQVPPQIDVIAHSRGGLVIRSLLEHLLPLAAGRAHFNRVIFVAATNGGTTLAEPENWNRLIDLSTNLAAIAFRVIGLFPQAAPVTEVLNEVIQGLGAFVKYVATGAIDEGGVPGLAAMAPDGPFITTLNEAQAGQPTIEASYYCVVSSEFEARLNGEHVPNELPRRLLTWAKDQLMDALLREPNDLVVNLASMSAIDPASGVFVKDTLTFGRNPLVYHSNYFLQPETVNAFTRWLTLAAPPTPSVQPDGGPAVAGPPSAATTRSALTRTGIDVPAAVTTDILPLSAATPLADAAAQVHQSAPSFVVVRRRHQGELLHYSYATADFFRRLEEVSRYRPTLPTDDLLNALDLHETDRSSQASADEVGRLLAASRARRTRGIRGPSRSRAEAEPVVVLAGDEPVGVLPPRQGDGAPASARRGPLTVEELAALARDIEAGAPVSAPEPPPELTPELEARIEHVHAMPSFAAADGAPSPPRAVAPAPAPPVLCYFFAEMEAEVRLGWTATLEVTLSREQIESATGAAAQGGSGQIDPTRKLIVLVQPRKNFAFTDEEAADDPGRAEVDPPAPDQPAVLQFDLRATDEGEGEVRVVIRQHQTPLATLTLRPRIVKRRGTARTRLVERGSAAEAEPLEAPLNQLEIYQRVNGTDVRYEFRLDARGVGPGLNRRVFSDPLTGDQKAYVRGRYKQIEDRWLNNQTDKANFLAELRAIGVEMFKELMPRDLREELWQYRDQLTSIQVQSDEPFIPWELVHLTPPDGSMPPDPCFLGQIGVVRGLDNIPWGPRRIKLRRGRARTVIPVYPPPDRLPEAEQEFDFLKRHFDAVPVEPPKPGVVRELLAAGDFDLLHFACHGLAEMEEFVDAELALIGDRGTEPFSATTVAAWANLRRGDNRPMVVLNACQVGRANYKLTGIGGFAQAFLDRGAGAFVGTLWSVGDSPARTFTERLYSELLGGQTLARASIAAREAARTAGDATWLAYVVYGHPHLRVES